MVQRLQTQRWVMLLACLLMTDAIPKAAGKCAPKPILLRVGDVKLANGKTRRGVEMGLGNPQQRHALMPVSYLDGFFVYGTDGFCKEEYNFGSIEWTPNGCTTMRGGAFDGSKSKTRKLATSANDTMFFEPDEQRKWKNSTRILDTLTLNANQSLLEFPLREATFHWQILGVAPWSIFGIGPNSTLLNTLKDSGRIASRSWAFAWGRPDKAAGGWSGGTDGSLVLGGYDKNRIKPGAKRFTQAMAKGQNADCLSELIVSISDIELNFPNGTNYSLFPKSSFKSLRACIQPHIPLLMQIPLEPYINNFLDVAGNNIFNMDRAVGLNWYNLRCKPGDKPYAGAMTIKLDNGHTVRMENDQIVIPQTNVDRAETSNFMTQLGMQFAANSYLMVNHDTNEFSMWSAAEPDDNAAVDLVAADTDNKDSNEFCAADASLPPPPVIEDVPKAPVDGNGASDNRASKAKLSPGALAGVFAGAVGVLVALGLLLLFCVRKRRAATVEVMMAAPDKAIGYDKPELYGSFSANSAPGWAGKSELADTSAAPIYEAPGSTSPRELAGALKFPIYEMPERTSHYELPSGTTRYELR